MLFNPDRALWGLKSFGASKVCYRPFLHFSCTWKAISEGYQHKSLSDIQCCWHPLIRTLLESISKYICVTINRCVLYVHTYIYMCMYIHINWCVKRVLTVSLIWNIVQFAAVKMASLITPCHLYMYVAYWGLKPHFALIWKVSEIWFVLIRSMPVQIQPVF